MKIDQEIFYRCPLSQGKLNLANEVVINGKIDSGLLCLDGNPKYRISDGIPDFRVLNELPAIVKETLNYYEKEAGIYDEYLPLTFNTFGVDEGSGGELHAQDLSLTMLKQAVSKLLPYDGVIGLEYSIGDATHLPYPDNYFDSAYHFGGLNTFHDIKKALKEIARVVKVGGKIVIGDESMPPWLRETEFGKILMNSNPHYKYNLPLKFLPECAKDVNLKWIIGGVFYLFDFTVGDGAPKADFDFEIPGSRGGTHRTRYFGNLEGVTSEAKELAIKAQLLSGKSMHQWLTDIIISEAKSQLR